MLCGQKKPLPASGIFRLWIRTVSTSKYCSQFLCARPRLADGRILLFSTFFWKAHSRAISRTGTERKGQRGQSPVSYTHLDVYKRQHLRQQDSNMHIFQMFITFKTHLWIHRLYLPLYAVSFMRLSAFNPYIYFITDAHSASLILIFTSDVYKRQRRDRPEIQCSYWYLPSGSL